MNEEWLILEKKAGVATLTLNRPQQLNSLPVPMFYSTAKMLDDIGKDDSVKVLIITGAGRGFSAGIDVGSGLPEISKMTVEELDRLMRIFTLSLHNLPKPTIAAINGVAAGAGIAIALLCDIRIASEKARFTSGYLGMGVIPDIGSTYSWPRIVGLAKSMELLLTGDTFDAAEALQIGLLNKVVPEEEVMKAAREIAGKIARGPSIAIEMTRKVLREGMHNSLEQQIGVESSGFYACLQTEDHQEGLKAFMEKRPAEFKGK